MATRVLRHAPRGLLVVAAVFLVQFAATGGSQVRALVDDLAASGKALTIAGGDVSLRDAPMAQEYLHGRFFNDPYYAGETQWYPFATPLIASLVTVVTGSTLPEGYFRTEPLFLGSFFVMLGVALFAIARWHGVLVLGVALLADVVPMPGSIYPAYSSRGVLCATLLLLAFISTERSRGALRARWCASCGLGIGALGVWHGASFFVTVAAATIFVVVPVTALAIRKRTSPRSAIVALAALAGGALVPMALLIVPQLVHYGTLKVPQAARSWIETGIYGEGGLTRALAFERGPGALAATLIAVALARALLARRLRLPRERMVLVTFIAFAVSVVLGHLGFLVADRQRPALAAIAKALLPAPPHTFLVVSETTALVLQLVGVVTVLEIASIAARRLLARRWPISPPAAVRALGGAAVVAVVAVCAVAAVIIRPKITRHAGSEPREFVAFAAKVGELVDQRTVFFRYPGRFVQHVALKIPLLSVDHYANPYAHRQRAVAMQQLDEAMKRGDLDRANEMLSALHISFTMEHPRHRDDPVIRLCSGTVLAEYGGYVLRERAPCHR